MDMATSLIGKAETKRQLANKSNRSNRDAASKPRPCDLNAQQAVKIAASAPKNQQTLK
jgi:hypothetical protein